MSAGIQAVILNIIPNGSRGSEDFGPVITISAIEPFQLGVFDPFGKRSFTSLTCHSTHVKGWEEQLKILPDGSLCPAASGIRI